jgi:hypothetical protein
MVSWITTLNFFLVLVIFVAALSIPGGDDYDARFTGDVEDEERKDTQKLKKMF